MAGLREFLRRLWGTVRRHRRDADLEEELRLHLALAEEDEQRRGHAASDARRLARLRAGGLAAAMDAQHDQRGLPWLDDLARDGLYGWRGLRRNPLFASVAVVTLALAIGVTTAIFSVAEVVMLRTVPMASPDDVYFVGHGSAERPGLGSNYPYLERVRSLSTVFTGVTAYTRSTLKVSYGGPVEIVQGQFVSGNYHGVLGIPIVHGRGFVADDDRAGANALTAVISDVYWARQFGRRPDVLGQTLVVDGRPIAVVGVTAPGFDGLEPGSRIEITLLLAVKVLDTPSFLTMQDTWTSMPIVARLRPGVAPAQAAAAVETVFQQYFSEPENRWLRSGPRGQVFRASLLVPAERGTGALRGQYATPVQVLMAMVGVVLLIACANVANLLLARGVAREREVAVRRSIGASQGRLIRQFLTEGLVLAAVGGTLGIVLARVGAGIIVGLVAVGPSPVWLHVQMNATVLLFAVAVSVSTGLLFAVAPAIGTTRAALLPGLKKSGAMVRPAGARWGSRHLLVMAQIGLCLMLVSGAVLLTRTLRNIETRDGGFDGQNVLMFSLDARGTAFPVAQMGQFCDDLVALLTSRYRLSAGSCSTSVPLDARGNAGPLEVTGAPDAPASLDERLVFMNRVTSDYFRALGITTAAGRVFDARESATSERVAVVNRATARFFFGADDPVGRQVNFFKREDSPMTIVGVVEDTAQYNLRDEPLKTVYMPLSQVNEPERFVTVALRSREPLDALRSSLRGEVRSLNDDIVVDYLRGMDEQIDATLVRERLLATVSSLFGLLALALAGIGLYGVVAYDLVRRAREFGVRFALGAQRHDLLRQALTGALLMSLVGVGLGLLLAMAGARLLSSLLFGITARDPVTLASVAGFLVLTTIVASYMPARRACRVDLAAVLRAD